MTLAFGSELATFMDDAGETFVLGDSTEFTGVWHSASAEDSGVRGTSPTIFALRSATECISIGDSIYRESDEPPVEYTLRDRIPDGFGVSERLYLERQDAA